MNVALLHTQDALEPPIDPVLDQLEDALRVNGHETRRVVVDDTVEPLVTSLTHQRPDLVFNIAESFAGKSALESNVAALLNLLKLRYTGSSPAGLILAGLQTEYQSPVLAEEFIDGREFYVGVLGNSNVQALPIIELDFSKFPKGLPKIASWSAKWGEDGEGKGAEFAGTESIFPTDLSEDLSDRIKQVAIDAFQALRLRDYARVDLRVTDAGKIYVIEVNPNCYLEAKSEFASSALKDGIEYPALINRIVELASARYSR